jgi:hypothetical protein
MENAVAGDHRAAGGDRRRIVGWAKRSVPTIQCKALLFKKWWARRDAPLPTLRILPAVIARAAKQSMSRRKERMDCFVARAPRNDGR